MPRVPAGLAAAAEARQRAHVRAADEAAARLGRFIEQRAAQLARRPDANRAALSQLAREIEDEVADSLDALAARSWRGWRRAASSALGSTAGAKPPSEDDIRRVRDRAFAGDTWRGRLRAHDLGGREVQLAVGGREPRAAREAIEQEARRIAARVRNLVRTEAHRLNDVMREDALRQAVEITGRSVEGWRYVTRRDSRVRPEHRARHGRVFPRGVQRIRLPDGPNCRCVYLPVTSARGG